MTNGNISYATPSLSLNLSSSQRRWRRRSSSFFLQLLPCSSCLVYKSTNHWNIIFFVLQQVGARAHLGGASASARLQKLVLVTSSGDQLHHLDNDYNIVNVLNTSSTTAAQQRRRTTPRPSAWRRLRSTPRPPPWKRIKVAVPRWWWCKTRKGLEISSPRWRQPSWETRS